MSEPDDACQATIKKIAAYAHLYCARALFDAKSRLKSSHDTRTTRQATPEFKANVAPLSRLSTQTRGKSWRGLMGMWRDCGAVY